MMWYMYTLCRLQGSQLGMAVAQDRIVRMVMVNEAELAIEMDRGGLAESDTVGLPALDASDL